MNLDRPGTLGGISIWLAGWRPAQSRYLRRYIPVDPEGRDIPGSVDKTAPESDIRLWHIEQWRGGEGEDLWQSGLEAYDASTNVGPRRVGDGLELGAAQSVPVLDGGAILNDSRRFGYGLGGLWTLRANSGYQCNVTTDDWDAAVATGAAGSLATSLTDGDDTFMYSGHEVNTIRRWNSGANAVWYNTGTGDDFANDPIVRSWGGILFA